MTTKSSKIDLDTFKDISNKCNQDDNNDDPIDSCKAVKRLVSSLKYYSMLDLTNNKDHQNIFSQFIGDIYTIYLDDYSHLVQKHKNLEDINKAMIEMKEFGSCDILKCLFSTRHHTDDQKTKVDDELVHFYAQSMDSLHFYFLHLYQCGLRTEKPNEDDNKDIQIDDVDSDTYFDQEFSRISRLIHERQHISASFNRFKNNNKFSLISGTEEQDDSKTFTDEMYSYFSRIEEISTDIISKF
eukprot:198878_1